MVVRVRVRVRAPRVMEMILHFLWLDYCRGKRKTKACLKRNILKLSN